MELVNWLILDIYVMSSSIMIESEQIVRQQLADAYQILAYLKMDDLTYTHLSARVPGKPYYFIYPFGLLFSEVTSDNLLTVSFEGEVIAGSESQYNKTGYVIHSAIYKARPDIHAIFHCHTIASVAVSAMECGLLPISQFALHFYERLAVHRYQSLALDEDEHGAKLVEDLGKHKAMMLQNHGTITCGSTIPEAFFYTYHLEQACKVQCQVMSAGQPLIYPPHAVCQKAVHDLLNFEENLGFRDWEALCRIIKK